MATLKAIKNGLALVLVCFLLTSCGFHLKKASSLPEDLKHLTLQGDDEKSALFAALKSELLASDVQLVAKGKKSAQLYLFKEQLERQTLSLFQNGQVAEYELTYSVTFVVNRPNEKAIEKRFELYRNYQDDPDNALAKAKELALLISEIRVQASQRIVRELSQL